MVNVITLFSPLPPDTAPVYVVPKLSCIFISQKTFVAAPVFPNVKEIVLPVVVLPSVKLTMELVAGLFKVEGLNEKGEPVKNKVLGAVPAVISIVPVVPMGVEEKLCTAVGT